MSPAPTHLHLLLPFALAACASGPVATRGDDTIVVCDVTRMAERERVARRSFTDVHWVHCPTVRVQLTRE